MKLSLRRRNPGSVRQSSRRARAGMSVVEAMVALTLFGTTTVGMAGLSLAVARRAEANDIVSKRAAVVQQHMNWLQALPHDSLPAKAGSATVSAAAFPYRRVISVDSSGSRTTVTVQITPLRAPEKGETITFDRSRPTWSPLCTGC